MLIIIGIVIIATCINVYLWKRRPYDGQMVITTDRNDKKIFSMELEKTPEEIEQMKQVSFKVVSVQSTDDILQLKVDYEDEVAD